MPHNPSRYTIKAIEADTQRAVDEYKARSVWGMWLSLDEQVRRRFFNDDERRWIRRYGAKLDEISCLVREPANEREKHFLAVCQDRAQPKSDRERLWLRVQVVCRYLNATERAARADLAEHRAAALEAEAKQLRRDLTTAEAEGMDVINELQMLTGETWARRRASVCNIEWATPRFAGVELIGPPPIRWMATEAHRGIPCEVFPPNSPRWASPGSPDTSISMMWSGGSDGQGKKEVHGRVQA